MTIDKLPPLEECTCLAVRQAARHVTQFYDRHLASVEAVANVNTDGLDQTNATLKRLERFWIDQVRFRL